MELFLILSFHLIILYNINVIKTFHKGVIIVHNRSFNDFQIHYRPIELSNGYLLLGSNINMHSPSEKPITFLHFHNCIEIGYCFEGNGIFIVENKVFPFSKGDVCIIFKDEMHIAQSSESNHSKWKFVYFDPIWLLNELSVTEHHIIYEVLKNCRAFPNLLTAEKHLEIVNLILDILSELENCAKNYTSLVKSQLWLLFLRLSRIAPTEIDTSTTNGKDSMNKITAALNYISNNYMNSIEINQLATLCQMSEPHFRRVFKSTFKVSPSEYIFKVRVKMAYVLLRYTDTSVLDISGQVGFESPSSFFRHFKTITGLSPRDWRKKFLEKQE